MLVLSLPAFENKKYTAYDRFQGNGPYGEIPTKKEPIRTLGFTLPYNKCVYWLAVLDCVAYVNSVLPSLLKPHQCPLGCDVPCFDF